MSAEIEREFDEEFWPGWPNKKAKADARKAYKQARRKTSKERILAGRETYKQKKESWRSWMLAGTFLRGERWEDEYGDDGREEKQEGFVPSKVDTTLQRRLAATRARLGLE